MSHRMRPTVADVAVADMLGRYPTLLGIDHVIDAGSEEAFSMCGEAMGIVRRWHDGRVSAGELAMLENMDVLRPDHVALWSRWRTCRHVYRFDPALSEALSGTESPDDMPTESLGMLPYPIVFVRARLEYPTIGCRVLVSNGFFAWCEDKSLQLVFVCDDRIIGVTVYMDGRTLGQAIDKVVDTDTAVWGDRIGDGYHELVRATITSVVAHLLYIISDRSEQEVVYRPSGKASTRKASPSTVHDVGVRTGRMLGRPSVRYVPDGGRKVANGGSGRTVRAHVRSAHWHHYWVGKRDSDERRLVLRWVYPTLVAAGGGIVPDTVVHAAKSR